MLILPVMLPRHFPPPILPCRYPLQKLLKFGEFNTGHVVFLGPDLDRGGFHVLPDDVFDIPPAVYRATTISPQRNTIVSKNLEFLWFPVVGAIERFSLIFLSIELHVSSLERFL